MTTQSLSRRELLVRTVMSAGACALPLPLLANFDENSAANGSSVQPFSLDRVRLMDGPFKYAQRLNTRYLLSLNPDRLLHDFLINAKLEPKAPVYGGWESWPEWVDLRAQGQPLAFHLSACAMTFAATGDERLKRRVDYIVGELAACQQARGDGLICAYSDGTAQLENSLAGKPFIGAPWYTMDKVMAGLRDAHIHAGNSQAMDMLLNLATWVSKAASQTSEEQFQKLLEHEHGCMNGMLGDVFALTGDRQFLTLAEKFNHQALLDPLAGGRDILDHKHSNTQIPKFVGFQRLYELTGNETYAKAASFFWTTVTERRSFATGGNGDGEHFFPVNEFAKHIQSAQTMETCCTYNMLRLTKALFERTPAAAHTEYYERALFNSILGSQDPQSGMMTYFQATRPGYVKLYCTPFDSFWCCTCTGMVNHAKYGEAIYFHTDNALYVNLFIASELNWREKDLRIVQTTNFPNADSTRFAIHARRPTRVTLKIRQPFWSRLASVTINGRPHLKSEQPGTYVDLDRSWRDGDVIEVSFSAQLRLEPLPGAPDIAALMYGPIVLAGRFGTEALTPGCDLIIDDRTSGRMLNIPMELPKLALLPQTLEQKVKRNSSGPLSFSVRGSQPDREIELIPYYRIAHERYSMYWQLS